MAKIVQVRCVLLSSPYADAEDPLRRAWDEFVLSHIDPYDRDHYETVWSAVARTGPEGPPFTG